MERVIRFKGKRRRTRAKSFLIIPRLQVRAKGCREKSVKGLFLLPEGKCL